MIDETPRSARLADGVAVVTGASSGIGRAVATALAHEGMHLLVVGRNEAALDGLRRSTPPEAIIDVEHADLGADDGLERAATRIRSLDRVDVLVHGAGVIVRGPVAEVPVAELDLQFRINVRAPYALTQAALPALRRANGQIVFVNSTAGRSGVADAAQYAATKHALVGFADSLRLEVNEDGIRVFSIFPGRTDTPMQKAIHEIERAAYFRENLIDPAELAKLVIGVLSLPPNVQTTDVVVRPLPTAERHRPAS